MPSLSIIMIVKNEESVLGDCLASVAGIADEIVVGDTGSTDETAAVAARFGARIHTIPWKDDFAAARNETIRLAWGDWLLHLDADEVLDPENAARIRDIVDTDDASDAVELILANYCNDPRAWRWVAAPPDSPFARGYSGYLPVGLLRLFRNRRGIEYREAVHENITESVLERGGVIRPSSILVHHYGYECSGERRREKAQFYLRLAREKAAAAPHEVKSLYDLAEQALACGEVLEAETACRAALDHDPHHVGALTTLANLLLNRGDTDAAHDLLIQLERSGCVLPHVQTALGAIAVHRGALDEAEIRLARVREEHPPAPIASLYLARALDHRGDAAGALAVLESLVQSVPSLPEPRTRIEALNQRRAGEAAYVAGDHERALAHFVAALQADREDALAHNNAGVALHALGDRIRARDSFIRALQLAPGLADARRNLEDC